MNFLPPAAYFIVVAFLTWKLSNLLLQRVFKVEKAMSEAVSWALTMIIPLLSLYIWGSLMMK